MGPQSANYKWMDPENRVIEVCVCVVSAAEVCVCVCFNANVCTGVGVCFNTSVYKSM